MNIKAISFFIILFSISLFCVSQDKVVKKSGVPDVLSVIHSRKSVRHFTEQKVSREQLEVLLRAGMAAPTAVNRQPWAFVAIDSREVLDSLSSNLSNNAILKRATAAIVVCGDMNKVFERLPDFWIQDCSAASQNILLAVEGIGLGAVWIGVFPNDSRVNKVKSVLNLPENLVPLNIIAIGYPTGVEKPKDKWKEENVIWNRF